MVCPLFFCTTLPLYNDKVLHKYAKKCEWRLCHCTLQYITFFIHNTLVVPSRTHSIIIHISLILSIETPISKDLNIYSFSFKHCFFSLFLCILINLYFYFIHYRVSCLVLLHLFIFSSFYIIYANKLKYKQILKLYVIISCSIFHREEWFYAYLWWCT